MRKILFSLLILALANTPPHALGWTGAPSSSVNLKNSSGTAVAPRQNLDKGESGGESVPVGFVLVWTSASNPTNLDKWLECNGQGISSTAYPELYAIVGANVPDYRGYFLRGVGGNSDGLNVAQGDAMRNIYIVWPSLLGVNKTDYNTGVYGGLQIIKWGRTFYPSPENGNGYWYDFGSNYNSSRHLPTANENRPVNKAVRYFIRAKP